jgi:hypothetical protein
VPADLLQVPNALLEALAQFWLVAVVGQKLDIDLTSPVPLAEALVFEGLLPQLIEADRGCNAGERRRGYDAERDDDPKLGRPFSRPWQKAPPRSKSAKRNLMVVGEADPSVLTILASRRRRQTILDRGDIVDTFNTTPF